MIVEKDAAFACVAELGKKPCVQFKDVSVDEGREPQRAENF
jgi:hypothetical protein